jgi:hypothetical protein
MKNSVFRPSIDLYELLVISRHCVKQREELAKQRARLSAQQQELRKVQSKFIGSREPVVRVQKLEVMIEMLREVKI